MVVMHWLDRLTRRLADSQQIMVELNAHDVVVVSVPEQIDMSLYVINWPRISLLLLLSSSGIISSAL